VSTVIIIGGGGGHTAITRLVSVYHRADANQKAEIVNLLNRFVADANELADEVEKTNP